MLDLAPTLEHTIVERAEANGMTINDFLARLIASAPVKLQPIAPAWSPAPLDHSAEAQCAAVLAYISAPDEEVTRLHAPGIARLRAKLDAAANATPEEIAAADAEWAAFQARLDEPPRDIPALKQLFNEPLPF